MTMEKLPPHRVQAPYPILKAVFPHAIPAIHNWWASADTFIIQVLINSSIKKLFQKFQFFPQRKQTLFFTEYLLGGTTDLRLL